MKVNITALIINTALTGILKLINVSRTAALPTESLLPSTIANNTLHNPSDESLKETSIIASYCVLIVILILGIASSLILLIISNKKSQNIEPDNPQKDPIKKTIHLKTTLEILPPKEKCSPNKPEISHPHPIKNSQQLSHLQIFPNQTFSPQSNAQK